MDKKKEKEMRNWLTGIMPAVVGKLLENLSYKDLSVLGECEGVHKYFSVELDKPRHHITAIKFHVMANDDKMLLTATPIMDDMKEIIIPDFDVNMTVAIAEYETTLTDDDHIRKMADIVLEQYRRAAQ